MPLFCRQNCSLRFVSICVWFVLTGLSLLCSLPVLAQEDEDDELKRSPGLVGSYDIPGGDIAQFQRIDLLPAWHLDAGQVPDPRITRSRWTTRWQGVLEIRAPGKYQFAAISSGPVTIRVGEQTVLSQSDGNEKPALGPALELGFGLQPLEILVQQEQGPPRFQLWWSGETFPLEPVPSHVLGHRETPNNLDFEQGWLQLEEHSCIACHTPAAGSLASKLTKRPGPHLTELGTRTNAAYIYHWLGDPQQIRPGAVMPQMFAKSRQGDLERQAVALFLTSLGQPKDPPRKLSPDQKRDWPERGAVLFQQTGCVVCHEPQGGRPARVVLQFLGQKTTPEALAKFLLKPDATDPAGRMPAFALKNDEAYQLALHLTQRDAETAPRLTLPPLPTLAELEQGLSGERLSAAVALELATLPIDEQLRKWGRRIVQSRGCINCHELKIPGEDKFWQPKPSKLNLGAIAAVPQGGCLLPAGMTDNNSPRFAATLDRPTAAQVLAVLKTLPAAEAPGHHARLTLQRMNCIGCHERNGSGGLSADLVAKLVVNQTEQNAETVSPPPLTGVTQRLLSGYLTEVLEQGRRSRPWMALKMPQFAVGHVRGLSHGLASLEGEPAATESFRPSPNPELVAAGRQLLGDKGFSCFKCHDLLDVAAQGTRAPELSLVAGRINYAWFDRWLRDPQRLQPGTRMPTIFPNGKSQYDNILGGDPERQRLAIWHYLLEAKGLPYPDGLKSKTPEVARVTDKPLLVRTFLPGTTPRGMAIQFPNQVHLAFDAQACRLAYAWSGEFLDMSPVWNGRGGQKAGIKGQTFWTAPEGFPWSVTHSAGEIPDYTGRGTDTVFGAEVPHDGQLHPSKVHFIGYKTSGIGPEFKYRLDLEEIPPAEFREQIGTLTSDYAPGLWRKAQVQVQRGQFVWLQVAVPETPPEWWDQAEKTDTLADGETVSGSTLLTVRQQGQTYYLRLVDPDSGVVWMSSMVGNQRRLLLRLPSVGDKGGCRLTLLTWRPREPDPETRAALSKIPAP